MTALFVALLAPLRAMICSRLELAADILTTASDVLFTGGREGYFMAFDALDGKLLRKASLGGQIVNGPITYELGGVQYVATAAGNSLFTFALRN